MMLLLLLILSLMTGSELTSEEKICTKGWVEFTCNQTSIRKCQMTKALPSEKNTLRVIIEQHQTKTSSADSEELEFEIEKKYPNAFLQTAYRTAKTTIRCDYPENKYKSWIRFFCKGNNFTCKDNLSTKSNSLSNILSMSLSDVSSQDEGNYWCGVRSPERIHQAALMKITLRIKNISSVTKSPAVGENVTFCCIYNKAASYYIKFLCKGEDPSICKRLVSTRDPDKNKRFLMDENKEKKNLTITVREVTADDSGTYWCGAERSDENKCNTFFNRLSLTVGQTGSAGSHGITAVRIVAIIIAGLVFLVVFILIYKRVSFSKGRGTNAALQHVKEDCVYEEIQEGLQQPDQPENALNSIYVTASMPTNVAASPLYASISLQSRSDKPGGEALTPSISACEYSILTLSECPTNPTITQPSRPTEENLYSAVNGLSQIRSAVRN